LPRSRRSFLTQGGTFQANAKLGTPYLVGAKRYIAGTKTELDVGSQTWVTLHSVKSCLRFDTKKETYYAPEGNKLFIVRMTVKNPSKVVSNFGPNGIFGFRVNSPGGKAGDYECLANVTADLGLLDAHLKQNESVEILAIFRAPMASNIFRLGVYRRDPSEGVRWYDLTPHVESAPSPFKKEGFVFTDVGRLKLDQPAEFDWVEVKPIATKPLAEANAIAVEVQVTNRGFVPARWGWQYARATLSDGNTEPLAFYPELIDKATGKPWVSDIDPGKSVILEYRFYPKSELKAKTFTLTSAATKRSIIVDL